MRRTYWISVEQIATIIAALMLASCVRVHAQFGVEQPFFFQQAPAAPVNPLPGNLAYRWVFTNLATNAVVTNWVDVIQGASFTGSNDGPFNTSSGVLFDGTNMLAAAAPAVTFSTNAVGIVWFITPMAGHTEAQYIWKREASSSGQILNYPSDGDYEVVTLGTVMAQGIPKGAAIDIIVAHTNSGTALQAIRCYTNAVYTAENSTKGAFLQYDSMGTKTLHAWILELQIYTNSGGPALSLQQITNIHNFRTNAYSGL